MGANGIGDASDGVIRLGHIVSEVGGNALNEDLGGLDGGHYKNFYAIANDTDATLSGTEIKLAATKADAEEGIFIDLTVSPLTGQHDLGTAVVTDFSAERDSLILDGLRLNPDTDVNVVTDVLTFASDNDLPTGQVVTSFHLMPCTVSASC